MKLTVKELVLMALYAALFVALDYMSNLLPRMPNGGSVGLGVIPLLLASYHLGWRKGLVVGIISVPLQFITGQMWYLHWVQFLLDYTVAFAAYGIASMFPNYKVFGVELYSGVFVTNLIRYVCVVMSGVIFWGEQGASLSALLKFSLGYNATYMVPTLIVSMILVPILHSRLSPLMK